MISREQAEPYEIIGNLLCKMFLVLVASGIFIATSITLIVNPNWYVGVFNCVWAVSIGPVMHHYFPSSKKTVPKKPAKRAIKKAKAPELIQDNEEGAQ
jgi:hypothetical protein